MLNPPPSPAAPTASDKYAALAAGLRALMATCPPDKLNASAMDRQLAYMDMAFHTLVRGCLSPDGDVDAAGARLSLMTQSRCVDAVKTAFELYRGQKCKKT